MYISFLLVSICYMLYGYFYLWRRKKSFDENGYKYMLWVINFIILIIFLIDFPIFITCSKRVEVNPMDIEVFSIGKYDSFDIISTYKDIDGNVYWSGAPIGHREWIEYGNHSNKQRICEIYYLPVTKIVVKIIEDSIVVYSTAKDILSMALLGFFVVVAMLLSFTKASIIGEKKSVKVKRRFKK